jgi:hypothetical protein
VVGGANTPSLAEAQQTFEAEMLLRAAIDARHARALVRLAEQTVLRTWSACTYDWDASQPQPESPPILHAVRQSDGAFLDTWSRPGS